MNPVVVCILLLEWTTVEVTTFGLFLFGEGDFKFLGVGSAEVGGGDGEEVEGKYPVVRYTHTPGKYQVTWKFTGPEKIQGPWKFSGPLGYFRSPGNFQEGTLFHIGRAVLSQL